MKFITKTRILIFLLTVFTIIIIIKNPQNLISKFKTKRTVTEVIDLYESKVLKKLEENFKKTNLTYENIQIAILAIKDERKLIVYAKNNKKDNWKSFKTYKFTNYSGKLGPKLREGDEQIPEGVYKLESLNPNSRFHLSLRVNYPNKFDKKKGKLDKRANLGSDIMIHGKNATIGCIPIGDNNIEEVFVLAKKSFNYKIPIIITPTDFRKNDKQVEIKSINWENQLYSSIKEKLKIFP